MKKILAYLFISVAVLAVFFLDLPIHHVSAVAQDIQYTINDNGAPIVGYYNVKDSGNKVFNWNVDVHSNGPGGMHIVTIGAYDETAGNAATTKHPFPVTPNGKTSYAEGESGSFNFSYDTARDTRLGQCGRVQIDGSFINETSPTYDDSNLFFAMVIDYGVDCPPPHQNQKPVITLSGSNPVNIVVGTNYVDDGATAHDEEDGDITANIVKTGTVNTSLVGTYILAYDVSDSQGLAADEVTRTVNVTPGEHHNIPPIANAGVDQIITLPISTVTLDGSASTDSDGTIVSYVWDFVSGPSTINPNDVVKPDVTGLLEGTYHFKLTVTDNNGATGDDGVTIVVHPVIVPPPVTAVLLTKSVNNSLGGDAVPSDFQLQIDQVNAVQDSFINVLPGMHTIGEVTSHVKPNYDLAGIVCQDFTGPVTGTDANGVMNLLVVKDHQYHCVVTNVYTPPVQNVAPIANAGVDQIITLPISTVTLDGSASTDSDGTIVSYVWDFVSGPSTINPNDVVKPDVTSLIAGTYVFKLTVTDNDGATGTDTVSIVVNPHVTHPQCSDGIDNDGDHLIDSADPGCHTDGNANNTNSYNPNDDDETDVHQNVAPIANAGVDQIITLPISTVTLDGSASTDSDGTIVSYVWDFVSGPSTINPNDVVKPDVTSLIAGTYVFKLTVTDNDGATGTDTVSIVVNPHVTHPQCSDGIDNDGDHLIDSADPGCHTDGNANNTNSYNPNDDDETDVHQNVAPIANAGVDQIITLPISTVTLDGSASTDSDGTIVSYVWDFVSGPSTINPNDVVKPDVTSLIAGTYVFKLTVTDNDGATGTDTVSIVVNPHVTHPQCSDGIDNDGDHLIDSADPGCHTDGNANNTNSYNPNDDDETDVGVDVCPNMGGIQLTVPSGRHIDNQGNCVGNGGGGSSGGGSVVRQQGQVLGAATSCGIYVEKYLRVGYQNDVNSVVKVQTFLNNYMHAGLIVDGIYGVKTEAAVRSFQLARGDKVLTPWGIDHSTGIFYLTTQTEVNNIMCPPLNLPIPHLINFSDNYYNTPPPIVGYHINV